jgi:TolB-like protein/DNA-binding winged helix-turn-helix (wHTH) protein/Tfp pilus assembly protein PilF
MAELPEQFSLLDLRLDLGQQRLWRGESEIPLPKLSYDLLLALARSAPNLVSLDELAQTVWANLVVSPETVSQRVKLLRDALGDDPKAPRYIESLRGRGYRLLVEVRPVRAAVASTAATVPPAPRRRLGAAVVTAFVLLAAIVGWRLSQRQPASTPAKQEINVVGAAVRTVAVLPFEDLSMRQERDPLALAVPEMVLQRLGSVKDLFVIARGSSFSFANQKLDVHEIGQRLHARYLVQGSLQRVGEQVRVVAQLVDAQSGRQMQAVSVDRNVSQIFEMQDEIASKVATALQVELLGADLKRVDRSSSTSVEAYLSYLNAQVLLNRWVVKDVRSAQGELEQAIKLDPKFALAYAELARAHWLESSLKAQDGHLSGLPEILKLANKAIELDPRLGEAYFIRAQAGREQNADGAVVEADFKRGIELAPNYGPGYAAYADSLMEDPKRRDESLALIERAILIDPVAPRNVYERGLFEMNFDPERAEQSFVQALQLDPEFPPALTRLAGIRWHAGELAQAIKLIESALKIETEAPWIRDVACSMYLGIGDRPAAASLAAGSAAASDRAIMLAVYDRRFKDVPQGLPLESADFLYVTARWQDAISNGAVDGLRSQLRQALHFDGDGLDFKFEHDQLAAVLALGALLNQHNDSAAVANLVAQLRRSLGSSSGEQPRVYAAVEILDHHPDAALAKLSSVIKDHHRAGLWMLERDPSFDALKNDPRFVEIMGLDHARSAEQRLILDGMRRAGEVPVR